MNEIKVKGNKFVKAQVFKTVSKIEVNQTVYVYQKFRDKVNVIGKNDKIIAILTKSEFFDMLLMWIGAKAWDVIPN